MSGINNRSKRGHEDSWRIERRISRWRKRKIPCRKGKELFLFINRSRALNGLNGAASILSRLFYIYVDKEGGGK